jgi:hypothetical protein
MALNLKSSLYELSSGRVSGTAIRPSSMLTTSDIVGLSVGDAFVHKRATLTIVSASSMLTSDPNVSSTSSIKLPLCCK